MENKPKGIIVDLEGTLSNCQHRIHFYKDKDYDSWNDLFPEDVVNLAMVEVIREWEAQGVDIILMTAKSISYHAMVTEWLDKHELKKLFQSIHYRPAGDHFPSVVIKAGLLKIVQKTHRVICAYDDRDDNLDMFLYFEVDCRKMTADGNLVNYLPEKSNHIPMKKTPADYLRMSADVFEERDKAYGSSYKQFGKILMAFFPEGLAINCEDDMNRYGIFHMMLVKMQRYANNFYKGGHKDSLVDLSTYSAMLNEVDNEL